MARVWERRLDGIIHRRCLDYALCSPSQSLPLCAHFAPCRSLAHTPPISSPHEFKFGKMSSSVESDRGSIVNALAMLERQDELVSPTRFFAPMLCQLTPAP